MCQLQIYICASAGLKGSANCCRIGLERTCPSHLAGVYEYIALVIRCEGVLYAEFPDIQGIGLVRGTTMEELKQTVKVRP